MILYGKEPSQCKIIITILLYSITGRSSW